MTMPLDGVRVVEFTHMVMGPTCGMVLGDLGAEVIKVEPPGGDKTRTLGGLGAGFFRTFNRNKKSIAIDLEKPEGLALAARLVASADVVSENFRPGYMKKLGFDYGTLSKANPRLIYVSLKGFLPGPYENRTALDEVVQMMGGLAYMTGPTGRPLRAGTSVNDIMGGLFGAIGVMAALRERETTGRGQEVQSALFENCAFLGAQHMQGYAVTGILPTPLPDRRQAAWGIYDIFEVAGGEQIFIAVTGDKLWQTFCAALRLTELGADPRLATNNARTGERAWLIPALKGHLESHEVGALQALLEANGIPFARIARPQDLFDDPHLNASGGLGALQTDDGRTTKIPLLPFTLGGRRLGARMPLPSIGEQSRAIMRELGYSEQEADALFASKAVLAMKAKKGG
jgi:crotonobetainyl-CoA:carnitine CoA-transferase CaiB-like acyl-CoA transferase